MSKLLTKKVIDGVEIEIRLSEDPNESDPDLVTRFIYELVNFDND